MSTSDSPTQSGPRAFVRSTVCFGMRKGMEAEGRPSSYG